MNPNEDSLHLVSLRFDARRLYVEGRDRNLPLRDIDLGYLLHCHFMDLFGEMAPKPFSILNNESRDIQVLGYSTASAEMLRDQARQFATPEKFSACDWERCVSKPVPTEWHPNQRIGFALRACPVQRMAGAGHTWRKGSEVDVFLVNCWKAGTTVQVDREVVYAHWLEQQFNNLGGASLWNARLVGFQRERLFRQTRAGLSRRVERPDGRFEGELIISDPVKFHALLRRGIGRHRAFGFGMLLLRPAGNTLC
jgi:CRISPR system Cascade subunit CasE